MTPDFAEFLFATPEEERHGPVFPLATRRGGVPFAGRHVGRVISEIGERAGVVVNKAEGKFASAHDLRRAFGTRWARRVMSAVLKDLMRHADIQTTMAYYVDLNADEIASDLWANHSKPAPKSTTLSTTVSLPAPGGDAR